MIAQNQADAADPRSAIRFVHDGVSWCVVHGGVCITSDARKEIALRLYSAACRGYAAGLGRALELEAEVARLRAEVRSLHGHSAASCATRLNGPRGISRDDVYHAVGAAVGLPMLSRAYMWSSAGLRTAGLVRIRMALARVFHDRMQMSCVEIADAVGVRSHSSVVQGMRRVDAEVDRIVSEASRILGAIPPGARAAGGAGCRSAVDGAHPPVARPDSSR